MDENKFPGLENLAKAGSYIQFFTVRGTRTRKRLGPKHNSMITMRQATVIGTIPSSIDSLNGDQSEEEEIKHQEDQKTLEITAEESDAFHQKAIQLLQVPFLGPGKPEAQVQGKAPDIDSVGQPTKQKADDGFPKEGYYMKSLNLPRDMYFRKGEFGCVSESGMFITQSGAGKKYQSEGKIETKIDIPYSFVCKTYGEPTFKIKRQFVN